MNTIIKPIEAIIKPYELEDAPDLIQMHLLPCEDIQPFEDVEDLPVVVP